MALVPYLERDQVPPEIQHVYDSLVKEAGKTELDEGLHKELKAYLSDQGIVGLCATVATANFTNRITGALKPELEGH